MIEIICCGTPFSFRACQIAFRANVSKACWKSIKTSWRGERNSTDCSTIILSVLIWLAHALFDLNPACSGLILGSSSSLSLLCIITLIYTQKLALMKLVFYGYFVGAEHEYDIKNCCLALVSKIQEAVFMYSAFGFQIRVWVVNDNKGCLTLWLVYMISSSVTGD
jgi:hypothetical protein